MRGTREPCVVEGCEKLGMLKKHCHTHYITLIYRNRPEVKERLHGRNRTVRSRFNRGKSFSSRHGIEWAITLEQYEAMILSGCAYCGGDISNETGRGLDRTDTHVGYTLENVQPCCGRCNTIRGQRFTPDQIKTMMASIKNFHEHHHSQT